MVSCRQDDSPANPQSALLRWALRFKNHWLFTWLVLRFAWAMSLRYPWFAHLKYTVRRKAQTDNSTVTGCPNCNQCVRVEWQPLPKRLASAAWPQNTGNSFHFAVRKKTA